MSTYNGALQEYNVSVDAATTQGGLNVVVSSATARASQLRQTDAQLGSVVDNRLLTQAGAVEKRHIGMRHQASIRIVSISHTLR